MWASAVMEHTLRISGILLPLSSPLKEIRFPLTHPRILGILEYSMLIITAKSDNLRKADNIPAAMTTLPKKRSLVPGLTGNRYTERYIPA